MRWEQLKQKIERNTNFWNEYGELVCPTCGKELTKLVWERHITTYNYSCSNEESCPFCYGSLDDYF